MICLLACLPTLIRPPGMCLPDGSYIALCSIPWPSPGCANCSFHILLLDSRINFWGSAFALSVSSKFRPLHYFLPTVLLPCFMSGFNHLIDMNQILIFLAVAFRMLPMVSYHLPASCSIASAVHSASGSALCLASSIHSFSTASMSSPVIPAKFEPTTHS
jgi:multidrug transporter EmrE-like cation transporter